ncbi:MAG: hypothetical protein Q9201_001100 [Fulgogasparrea decipioides]
MKRHTYSGIKTRMQGVQSLRWLYKTRDELVRPSNQHDSNAIIASGHLKAKSKYIPVLQSPVKELPMIFAPLGKRYEYNETEVTPSITPPLYNTTTSNESEEQETNDNSSKQSLYEQSTSFTVTKSHYSNNTPQTFHKTSTSLSTTAICRTAISEVLNDSSDKLVVVVGPCSIHDHAQALEYAHLLAQLSAEPLISSSLVLVMRAYLEKPRTTIGWKGLLNDPDLDGTFQIDKGLHVSRKLFSDITKMGVPIASELLGILAPSYLSEFLSLGAIGARTTESQVHRELASGMPFPLVSRMALTATLAWLLMRKSQQRTSTGLRE